MDIESGTIHLSNCTIQFAGGSDTGIRRSHNEDSFVVIQESCIFCVADGVGGLDAGKIASKKAISSIKEFGFNPLRGKKSFFRKMIFFSSVHWFFNSSPLMDKISYANGEVYQLAQSLRKKMATTIVALELKNNIAEICNVGDSRAYLFRNNILGQLTIDHTLAMSFYLAGVHTVDNVSQHTITRALGANSCVEVDSYKIDFQQGDTFLICSDGLTDMLSNRMISRILRRGSNTFSELIHEFIHEANVAGGGDNISVIVVTINPLESD